MRYPQNYINKNSDNRHALGVCDFSGFTFNHKNLHKQYDWRGNRLVWTGFLVGTPYLDVPQEQSRPPAVKADPYPIINPRPPITNGTKDAQSNNKLFNITLEAAPGTVYVDGESIPPLSLQQAIATLNIGFTNQHYN